MKVKRNRTIKEKIQECLDDKVQNLHPDLREKLFVELQNVSISSDVAKCKSYVSKLLSLPETGRQTKQYWISRGWSEVEAYIKSQENTKKGIISPYSIQFWTSKINPNTGKHYTEDEANYERNSRRPIRKEYWIKKGYSLDDAEKLATDTKNTNNENGAKKSKNLNENIKRVTSKRCLEYWTIRGFSEIEGKKNISQEQSTFSLKTCIEKYGEDDGKQRWLDRQEKWHKSYKKSNFSKVSQLLFWEICSHLNSLDDIFFAELDENKKTDKSGKNNELRLKLDRLLLPDFIDVNSKKIIEFDGTYWHGLIGKGNKNRDIERNDIYKKNGYLIHRVSENDYKLKKQTVIEECLNFLKK
jgi:ribosome-binding factor A